MFLINKVVKKGEYSRVHILHKEMFFCKFAWEYKVISFSKVKVIYRESPQVMVNKCVACKELF